MTDYSFATVGGVYTDGLSLIFDGESEPSDKHYKCNTSVNFAPGDRVRVLADSGTYVVEYVVGVPSRHYYVPDGGSPGQVLTKASADSGDTEWQEIPGGLPSGGTAGQVLTKASAVAGDVRWETPAAPSVSGLKSGSHTLDLSSAGVLTPSSTSVDLGSAAKPFGDLYTAGEVVLGTASYTSRLGFFGATAKSRKTLYSTATLADLIAALKDYGLFA